MGHLISFSKAEEVYVCGSNVSVTLVKVIIVIDIWLQIRVDDHGFINAVGIVNWPTIVYH